MPHSARFPAPIGLQIERDETAQDPSDVSIQDRRDNPKALGVAPAATSDRCQAPSAVPPPG